MRVTATLWLCLSLIFMMRRLWNRFTRLIHLNMYNTFGVNIAPRFLEDWAIEKWLKPINSYAVVVQDEMDNALSFVAWGVPYVIYREVDENNDGQWWKIANPVDRAKAQIDRIDPRLVIYEGNEPDTKDWRSITSYYRAYMDTIAKAGRRATIIGLHAGDIERYELLRGDLDELLQLADEYKDYITINTHGGSFAHLYWGYGQQPENYLLEAIHADPSRWPLVNPVVNWIPITEQVSRTISADSYVKDGSDYLMFPNPLLMDRDAIAMLYYRWKFKGKSGPKWIETEFTTDISGPSDHIKGQLLRYGTNGYGRHAGIQTLPELYRNHLYPNKSFSRAYHDQLKVVMGYLPDWKLARIHFTGSWQARWSAINEQNGHNIFGHTDLLELIAAEPFYRSAGGIVVPPVGVPPPSPIQEIITVNVKRNVKEIRIVLTD